MTEMKPVTEATAVKAPVLPDAQTVTEVKHWTDSLFSFRVSRPATLRFRSGEFVMIGLMGDFPVDLTAPRGPGRKKRKPYLVTKR